ncbi:MAG: TIR domain-containing protein, partial [Candidatus Hodarchaeota archaeon]
MSTLTEKIEKLIQQGESFRWEDCSYSKPEHGPDAAYGKKPSAEWNAWVGRIEHILRKSVRSDSEPYIYFKTANTARIEGNYKDQFDMAKDGYIGALKTLKKLVEEGDIFGELLLQNTPRSMPESDESQGDSTVALSGKKVFIVHGHDHQLKIELEAFLSHIGLEPIVLHREVDAGKTVIEKFETNSDVAYAFILLTPDEIAYTTDQQHLEDSERKKEYRAKPNVIFEFGYFVAKLGRNRVCALYKGDVVIPSDLSGFVYKKVDENVEDIGFSLIIPGTKIELNNGEVEVLEN